jgi:hypothetical protein
VPLCSLATLDKERVDIPIFALPRKCQISTSSAQRVALYDLTRTPLKCVRVVSERQWQRECRMHAYYALINDEPFTDGLADADARSPRQAPF